MKAFRPISWRLIWYSVFIWFLAIVASAVIVAPWFYLVLPVLVYLTCAYYFKKRRINFESALKVSFLWFLLVCLLSVLEIMGPYYFNIAYFFSDQRNWAIYPLVLLIPSIYALISENNKPRTRGRRRSIFVSLKSRHAHI